MPGIVGCLSGTGSRAEITAARQSLRYSDDYQMDHLFEDAVLLCSRTHLGRIGEKESPIIDKDHQNYCWIEGEFYNKKKLGEAFSMSGKSEAQFLLAAYSSATLENLLQKIDGYFTALIYDSKKQKILFLTDRYGFKPMYLWQSNQDLAFSSEAKGFLSLSKFKPLINTQALDCFMATDQLIGDLTWFSNVRRLPAATIVSYDLQSKQGKEKRYWTWASIKSQNLPFDQVAGKVADLLKKAMEKRVDRTQTYLGLSGGLDSRALLAFAPDQPALGAYTFGQKRAEDIRIAQKMASYKKMDHRIFILNQSNWMDQRLEGIWKTEGMLNLFHLHAAPFQKEIKELAQININGLAGGLILGGRGMGNIGRRIEEKDTTQKFGNFASLQKWDDPFYDIHSGDPYFLDVRMRRFTQCGLEEMGKLMELRAPFLDNDLVEFIFSLPDDYRKNSRLFKCVFQKELPAFLAKLPWEATGYSLQGDRRAYFYGQKFFRRLRNKMAKGRIFGLANYEAWLEQEYGWIKKMLQSPDALYRQFTQVDFYKKYFLPHREKTANHTWEIGRALTVEIWLQQVINQRFKNTKEIREQ